MLCPLLFGAVRLEAKPKPAKPGPAESKAKPGSAESKAKPGSAESQATDSLASKQILAVINGEELTYEQYDDVTRLAEFRYDYLSARRVLEIKRDFFTHLLERRLLVQEAARRGLSLLPEEMTERLRSDRGDMEEVKFKSLLDEVGLDYDHYYRLVYEDVIIDKLLSQVLPRKSEVSEREIEDYYYRHLGDFARQDRLRALHIYLTKKSEAKLVLASLSHGADFRELARRKSRAREADSGGDLGYFERGEMPAVFFDSCWRLAVGETSKIIKSKHGYHIFRLLDKVKGRMVERQETRPAVVDALQIEKREEFYGKFIQRLSERADIKMSGEAKFLDELRAGPELAESH